MYAARNDEIKLPFTAAIFSGNLRVLNHQCDFDEENSFKEHVSNF